MTKTFLTALLARALAFGMSNAFAQGVSSGKDRDLNTEQMSQAQTHAKAALEAAKGDAPGTLEHARASWNSCKDVTGETVMPYYERAMEKLGTAKSAAEKGTPPRPSPRSKRPSRTWPRDKRRRTTERRIRQPLRQPLTSRGQGSPDRGLARMSHHGPTYRGLRAATPLPRPP